MFGSTFFLLSNECGLIIAVSHLFLCTGFFPKLFLTKFFKHIKYISVVCTHCYVVFNPTLFSPWAVSYIIESDVKNEL